MPPSSLRVLVPTSWRRALRRLTDPPRRQAADLLAAGALDVARYRSITGAAGLSDAEVAVAYVRDGLSAGVAPCVQIDFAFFPQKVRDALTAPDGARRLLRYLAHDASSTHAWSAVFDPRIVRLADESALDTLRRVVAAPLSAGEETNTDRVATDYSGRPSEDQDGVMNDVAMRDKHDSSFRGFVDLAGTASGMGGALVSGWFLTNSCTIRVVLETIVGDIPLADGFRKARQDVIDAFGAQFPDVSRPGFTVYVSGLKRGDEVRMKAYIGDDIVVSDAVVVGPIPEGAKSAAGHVFGLAQGPNSQFHDYVRRVALPALSNILERRHEQWTNLPHDVEDFGEVPAAPKVSIIVPQYGQLRFVEHQLVEFTKDVWLRDNAELIYVIDDPKLVDQVTTQADAWFRYYGVPFRVVWGGANRGYSGANNLGADYAHGEHLLFLNSDAIPNHPGWLEGLVNELESDDQVGAVGPRLTFADGSLQHAGMVFRQRRDLHIWVNEHPSIGIEPKLDPAGDQPQVVPAVTGACMLMRRSDFDAVDGWDTGYLIGDFEDSDLCLKLDAIGKRSVYVPTVQLTHLERQSFGMLGDPGFRTRVVIFNAVRHETRWGSKLKELTTR